MVLLPFVGRSHQPVLAVEGGLHRRALKECHPKRRARARLDAVRGGIGTVTAEAVGAANAAGAETSITLTRAAVFARTAAETRGVVAALVPA
jgi:hypothetical protein